MRMAEKCAKTSGPPPSGSMKPNPLALLNHLTVPIGMSASLTIYLGCGPGGASWLCAANHKYFADVPKRVKTVRPAGAGTMASRQARRAAKQRVRLSLFSRLDKG